jgi:hypothetical protein
LSSGGITVSPYRLDAKAINNMLYDDYLAGKMNLN